MAVQIEAPLPDGFETWPAQRKLEYVERLWGVILREHPLEEIPVPAWQLKAAREAQIAYRDDPSGARPASGSIATLRERLDTASDS